jgi:hypothetical protein
MVILEDGRAAILRRGEVILSAASANGESIDHLVGEFLKLLGPLTD